MGSLDDIQFDQSATAEVFLDKILEDTSEKNIQRKKNLASVEDELHRKHLIEEASNRVQSRVLFVTNKTEIFEKDSLAQKHFASLCDVFDEVHVLVLSSMKREEETIRIAPKAWAYPVHIQSFAFMSFAVQRVVKEQLLFADGFRPDIIVALDPYESGVSALRIAQKYERPLQVHVFENFLTEEFLKKNERNKKRVRFANTTLKKAKSVRTETERLKRLMEDTYPGIEDSLLLPRFFNIKGITETVSVGEKKRLFPQFSFVLLYVGKLDSESTLFRVLDAARGLLRNPTIGLVVVGDGAAKQGFMERAKIFQIDKQVVFKGAQADIVPYMQAADVFVVSDTTTESERLVVTGAAAGVPMILAKTKLRDDLFTDGRDAFLCDAEDTVGMTQKLTKFINTNSLRIQFAENARDVVVTRIEESPEMYRLAYRDTVEAVLYYNEKKEKEAENAKRKQAQEQEAVLKEKLSQSRSGIEMKLPES